jgi:deoxyribose-phosphate aldolase
MPTTKERISEFTVETLSKAIDLTILSPDHTIDQVDEACDAAANYGFAGVCVAPYVAARAAERLRGTGVAVCGTVGIPLGYSGLGAKLNETRTCIEAGASEIDMVINLVAMKSGRYADVRHEIEAVRKVTSGCTFKVVLECSYLNDSEKARATEYAREGGADFIVTDTGFGRRGARTRDIELLRRLTGRNMQIKAAGDVTTFGQVRKLLKVGAARIGTSVGVDILQQFYASETE